MNLIPVEQTHTLMIVALLSSVNYMGNKACVMKLKYTSMMSLMIDEKFYVHCEVQSSFLQSSMRKLHGHIRTMFSRFLKRTLCKVDLCPEVILHTIHEPI